MHIEVLVVGVILAILFLIAGIRNNNGAFKLLAAITMAVTIWILISVYRIDHPKNLLL